jgi:hypothetical protein
MKYHLVPPTTVLFDNHPYVFKPLFKPLNERKTAPLIYLSAAPWQFGSCAETNTWFHLASQIPELPIRTCAIITKTQRNEIMLRELPNDREIQNTHDLASLIKLLKDKERYRDETNKDVLAEDIQLFAETYGITDFLLVFACGDSVFWLEEHGVIYFWSRIDDSMIRGGENLKEALTNYLFNQKNLCYVDENWYQ